jgi:D-cysteine desulfhydrase
VATAAFGKQYGIDVDLVLFDQKNAPHVQENLKLDKYYGAEMHHASNQVFWFFSYLWQAIASFFEWIFGGKRPYIMLPGDSNALSCLGYVNAAFELKRQIQSGAIPEPDYIYVAAGSCGTTAGLIAGLRLAGLKTKVVCVRVAAGLFCDESKVASLANDTIDLLREKTFADIPPIKVEDKDIVMLHEHYGDGYGEPTAKSEAAIAMTAKSDKIKLDSTYTGKAMAAMIDFAKSPEAKGKNIMFWDTLNSRDKSKEAGTVKPTDVDGSFSDYFK